jgi:hypothetical protein
MIRRFILAAFALGLLVSVAAPKPATACPLICVYKNGHWVCGCQ